MYALLVAMHDIISYELLTVESVVKQYRLVYNMTVFIALRIVLYNTA